MLLLPQVAAVVESLQRDMTLLCVTGVEDRLQVMQKHKLTLSHVEVHFTYSFGSRVTSLERP